MDDDQRNFEQFMKQREAAASAYINGDAAPLGDLSTHQSPATFFGPAGGHVEGASQVSSRYERDATNFTPGAGEGHFEILHMATRGDLGYWVGFQRATARMKGNPETIPFNLCVTEIFRREDDRWTLVHRHADPLMSEPEKGEK